MLSWRWPIRFPHLLRNSNMASIRVRFILGNGLVSKAIAFLTGSLFSHVEFGTDAGTWIGAHIGGGIQERAANYCSPKREYVYEIPCSFRQKKKLTEWMRSQIGVAYNVRDIIGLLFQQRLLTTPGSYICSQFVVTGLLKFLGGPEKVLNVLESWAYRVTPETLHLSPIFAGNCVKKISHERMWNNCEYCEGHRVDVGRRIKNMESGGVYPPGNPSQ